MKVPVKVPMKVPVDVPGASEVVSWWAHASTGRLAASTCGAYQGTRLTGPNTP